MPAKFNLLVAASIPAVALVPLLACGGGGSGSKDASVIIVHDSSNGSGSGSGSGACTFAANLTPTVSASATKYQAAGSGTNPIIWNENSYRGLIGGTQGSSDQKEIRILIFGGCGTTGTTCAMGSGSNDATPDWPIAFTPKSNLDLSLAATQHDVLILLLGDPDTTKYNTIYVAAAGTVNITKAANGSGSAFAGNGSGWDFIHVNTDFSPAADGCESIVPTFSWDGATFTQKDLAGGPDFDPTAILHHRSM
jgi:hypothetical protein